MGISVICALLLFLNVWRRTWMLPSVGMGLFVLSAILLGVIWPALVQQFQVDPTEADKEERYIAWNIEATRDAYDIADAEVEQYAGESELGSRQLAQSAIDSPGIRLVDPQVVQQTFEQRQQVRGYYTVAPILDVDNYDIDGQERDVVLAVRELNQDGISSGSPELGQPAHGVHPRLRRCGGVRQPAARQQPDRPDRPGAGLGRDRHPAPQAADRPDQGRLRGTDLLR